MHRDVSRQIPNFCLCSSLSSDVSGDYFPSVYSMYHLGFYKSHYHFLQSEKKVIFFFFWRKIDSGSQFGQKHVGSSNFTKFSLGVLFATTTCNN